MSAADHVAEEQAAVQVRGSRGADVLAASLARAGVRRVFSLSGNHIMPFYDALLDQHIPITHVRHEGAAVHMADAWARLTGEVGVALLTGGPGHANGVSALYTALAAESPVVLLSGQAPTNQLGRGAFQEMDQVALAAPLTKLSFAAASAQSIGRDFARATACALGGRPGPVYLSLPTDALEDRIEAPGSAVPPAAAFAPEAQPLSTVAAAQVIAALRSAQKPLVITGPASMTRSGRARAAALEQASGLPVIGMESPRGVNDPSLGAFAEVLAQTDLVVLIGKPIDFTLKLGAAIPAGCDAIVIDPDAAMFARAQRALGGARELFCALADPAAALAALTEAALKAGACGGAWRDEVRAAVCWRPAAWSTITSSKGDVLHPVEMCRHLQPELDRHPDAVLIADGGEIGQWAQACLSAPHRVINGVAGSIGSALPFGVAARLAFPEAPVLAVLGDGTFGFHPAEFDTAVRENAPFVAVVGNDCCWNAEHQIQLREYGAARAYGCELLPTRYDQVAAGFGGWGEQVTSGAALPAALGRAFASGKPACLNVMIERLPAPTFKRG
jgi:acetolactate synthase I/II/III large subunit